MPHLVDRSTRMLPVTSLISTTSRLAAGLRAPLALALAVVLLGGTGFA